MSRNARACLLILALMWQAVAWLSPLGQAQMTERMVNALTHAQSVAHHHANEAVQSVGLAPQAGDLTAEALRPSQAVLA